MPQSSMLKQENGYALLLTTFFVMVLMVSIAAMLASLTVARRAAATNAVASTQSYYAAESGVEDALLQINDNPQMSADSYTLAVGTATASVTIPDTVGGARTVTSQGSKANMQRKVNVAYGVDSENINFYYGVAVGAGGLLMGNGSRIMGSVFSGGNISGAGTIDNDVVISGNGNSLDDVYVGGNALVYSCLSPASVNNLTYVTGGTHTCTVRGTTSSQSAPIDSQPMPIPQSQIDAWKAEATDAGVVTGNVTISNGATQTMGPVKITGNLTISNNATLNMSGTMYVVGTITISNGGKVKLATGYGTLGGVLIADGTITLSNGSTFTGSGQGGSYVLVLSTSSSTSAINVSNNATGAVLYTTAGTIQLSNGVSVLEATGYRVVMSNNSTIQYSTGIQNIYFSGGPGGSNQVLSWEEE